MLPADPAGRAVAVWNLLIADHAGRDLFRRPVLRERGTRRQVPLWPYSQVMHARTLIRAITTPATTPAATPALEATGSSRDDHPPAEDRPADDRPSDLAPMLRRYSLGAAFTDRPGGQHRYLDDNAWVAIAQCQHRRLLTSAAAPSREAADLLGWLADRVDADGGVVWREGVTTRHACSTGSVGAALALSGSAGSPAHDAAVRCADFMRTVLTDDAGLVRDHVDTHGRIEATVWAYNQALLIRLETALACGENPQDPDLDALARADQALAAGLDHFTHERLWQQPVAFVAIWVRALAARSAIGQHTPLAVRALDAIDAYERRLIDHLEQHEGRIGGANEIGRYERGDSDVLDRAAAVQILALAALAPDQRSLVV